MFNQVQSSLLSLTQLIKIMFNEFNKNYVQSSLLSLTQLIKIMFNQVY
jgi:hypothetical protein